MKTAILEDTEVQVQEIERVEDLECLVQLDIINIKRGEKNLVEPSIFYGVFDFSHFGGNYRNTYLFFRKGRGRFHYHLFAPRDIKDFKAGTIESEELGFSSDEVFANSTGLNEFFWMCNNKLYAKLDSLFKMAKKTWAVKKQEARAA